MKNQGSTLYRLVSMTFALVAVLMSLLVSTPAHAGYATGVIQPGWFVFGDGNLFFYLSTPHQNSPCVITKRWAFNSTTPIGRSTYAAFLVAYSSGKSIRVDGSGSCIHGNTEEVYTFQVSD